MGLDQYRRDHFRFGVMAEGVGEDSAHNTVGRNNPQAHGGEHSEEQQQGLRYCIQSDGPLLGCRRSNSGFSARPDEFSRVSTVPALTLAAVSN